MSGDPERRGAKYHPFTGRDLCWLLDRQADRFGEKPFLIWEPLDGPEKIYSYSEFANLSRAIGAGLAARGIGRGDAVLIHLDNHPALLLAMFACARVGALAVTTNTRASAAEFGYFVEHSRARAIITEAQYAGLAEAWMGRVDWIASVDGAGSHKFLPFDALMADPAACPARAADPDLPCNVMYTSGTTSRPKGVVWTHANALWGGKVSATHSQVTADDRVLIFLPLFHTVALSWNFLASLWAGGSVVLCRKFSASRFWAISQRHGCTWVNMVGFTLKAIAAQPDPAEPHNYRFWSCIGDIASVRSRWGIRTIGSFGMTELISQPICSDLDVDGPEGSMGAASAEYQLSIRRPDGSEAAPEETGDLWVRGVPGVSVFHSYLHNPQATREAFDADGWFCTGDQAFGRGDGHLFFAGRVKDMLKVGAENVAAPEIEAIIGKVPGVVEVAVVGRPDPMLDEVPVAFVVSPAAGDELRQSILAACKDSLSDFKRPRDVYFVDALPRGLMDKILKRELREMAVQMIDPAQSQ